MLSKSILSAFLGFAVAFQGITAGSHHAGAEKPANNLQNADDVNNHPGIPDAPRPSEGVPALVKYCKNWWDNPAENSIEGCWSSSSRDSWGCLYCAYGKVVEVIVEDIPSCYTQKQLDHVCAECGGTCGDRPAPPASNGNQVLLDWCNARDPDRHYLEACFTNDAQGHPNGGHYCVACDIFDDKSPIMPNCFTRDQKLAVCSACGYPGYCPGT